MAPAQCPVCFAQLEVLDVTPCFICGGWPGMVELFNPQAQFREWRLPTGETLILCQSCELEEFMVPGGWGWRLGLKPLPLPINAVQIVGVVPSPATGKDRFCPPCNLRLAFLKILVASSQQPET
jgi:hypothetical protein